MIVTLSQQYNVGEKPTVILYTYINHHAQLSVITKHTVVTKRSNRFGYRNLDHSRSQKIEKNKKNGFGLFSYNCFVPIRGGLTPQIVDTYFFILRHKRPYSRHHYSKYR